MREDQPSDDVCQLRQWGTDRIYPVTRSTLDVVRTESMAGVELGTSNGPRFRGRLDWFGLLPSSEVRIGGVTLVAEGDRTAELRGFMSRLLGWGSARATAVDLALRSLRLAATRRNPLVLCGEGDHVPVARALHHRLFGPTRPFVVCDPRRREGERTVRAESNYRSAVAAMEAAAGGTLCVWDTRLPRDFAQVRDRILAPATGVHLVVCSPRPHPTSELTASAIEIPPLEQRAGEIDRIVGEYAVDALTALNEPSASFTRQDYDWVIMHEASSLASIEKASLRLVALRTSRSISQAAARLGMTHVSLWQWIARRALPMRTV